jgi:hypothetical protein
VINFILRRMDAVINFILRRMDAVIKKYSCKSYNAGRAIVLLKG